MDHLYKEGEELDLRIHFGSESVDLGYKIKGGVWSQIEVNLLICTNFGLNPLIMKQTPFLKSPWYLSMTNDSMP